MNKFVFFAFCALLGLTTASSSLSSTLSWPVGREFVFEYSGRLITGLPELSATHFSGVFINCQIRLQTLSKDTFVFVVEQPSFSMVNQRLEASTDHANWRQLRQPSLRPVESDMARLLAKPTLFKIDPTTKEVRMVEVERQQPDWIVNFQKAIVAIFQTKIADTQSQQIGQSYGQQQEQYYGQQQQYYGQQSEQLSSFWTTQEQSMDGLCEVRYSLNPLPSYLVESTFNASFVKPDLCQNEQYFELVKSKDVSKCERRSAFAFHKPGQFGCGTGNCDGMWSRSSNTIYYGCLSSNNEFLVQSVVNEGELQQSLFGMDTEHFLTGTKQVLRLVDYRQISDKINMDSNAVQTKSLLYNNKFKKIVTSKDGKIDLDGVSDDLNAINGAQNYGQYNKYELKPQTSELVSEIKSVLLEIVEKDLNLRSGVASETVVPLKGLSVARGMALLEMDTLKQLYTEMVREFENKGEESVIVFKNVFFDLITMGGSVKNVLFLKEQILDDQLTDLNLVHTFAFLPNYVVAPTRTLMKELFELVTSDYIRSKPFVFKHAVLAMSTLVQKACLDENRDTAYPSFVFGKMCSPDDEIVVHKWIPFLQKLYREQPEHKTMVVVALGIIGHRDVISVLLPIIETVEQTENTFEAPQGRRSDLRRFLAVYSLINVGQKYRAEVEPVLLSLFTNQAESTEVRMAAFNSLLSINPSMNVLHRIAVQTWHETDVQVLEVINTALFTLSRQSTLDDTKVNGVYTTSLAKKAYLVYPLIKRVGTFPYSSAGTVYSGDFLSRFGVGYNSVTGWSTEGPLSFLPTDFYYRIVYYLNRFRITPVEVGFRAEGMVNAAYGLVDALNKEYQQQGYQQEQYQQEQYQQQDQYGWHGEYSKVLSELKSKLLSGQGMEQLKSGFKNKRLETVMFMRVFENALFFVDLDDSISQLIDTKIMPLLKSSQYGRKEHEGAFNFQRVLDLAPSEFLIPSDMGLPIVVETHMPTTISVRGKLGSRLEGGLARSMVNISFNVRRAAQFVGWVGTICPFEKRLVVTVVDEHVVVNTPLDVELDVDLINHRVNMNLRELQNQREQNIDLLHYHVRPYTSHKRFFEVSAKVFQENSKTIKPDDVTGEQQGLRKSVNFGQSLGLYLTASFESEQSSNLYNLYNELKMYNFDPTNVLRFGWTTMGRTQNGQRPSVRRVLCKLQMDRSRSTTKEVQIETSFGLATKEQNANIVYHKLIQKQGQQQKQQQLYKHILPVDIEQVSINEALNIEESQMGMSQHKRHAQKLSKIIAATDIDSGMGTTFAFNIKFVGQQQQTRKIGYTVSLVGGQKGSGSTTYRAKWNVHLESNGQDMSAYTSYTPSTRLVCIEGHVEMPISMPVYRNVFDLESGRNAFYYNYENVVGFGNDCQSSKIVITGKGRNTEQQQKFAQKSSKAILLKKLIEQYEQQNEQQAGQPRLLRLSELAEDVRREASMINEIEYTIKFVNVPSFVERINERLIDVIKTVWWPHIVYTSGQEHTGYSTDTRNMKMDVVVTYNAQTSTFDLKVIDTQQQTIKFSGISSTSPVLSWLPLYPTLSYPGLITSSRSQPVCRFERNALTPFANKTIRFDVDSCFHVLAGNTRPVEGNFGVLVRSVRPEQSAQKEMKIFLGEKTVLIKGSNNGFVGRYVRHASNPIEVRIDGNSVNIARNQRQTIKDRSGKRIADITLSSDNVVIVDSKWAWISFDGESGVIRPTGLFPSLTGMCGHLDRIQGSKGSQIALITGEKRECLVDSEALAALNRVSLPSHQCEALPARKQQRLEQSLQKCLKSHILPTKVWSSYKRSSGQCTSHVHQLLETAESICFSRQPLPECSKVCRPRSEQSMVEKKVSFTCMPKNRVAEHYRQKVLAKHTLPEMASLEESKLVKINLPRECVPINHY